MTRLGAKEALSQAQLRALHWLNNTEGSCLCGREMSATSAKFIICKPGNNPGDFALNGSLQMFAFCYACAEQINGFLGVLKKRGAGWSKH